MRLKKVEDLDGTEIAAVDVCSNSNLVIIPKGSKLKKEYVSGLMNLDILSIFIEENTETLNRMDPEIDGKVVPLEVIDYYIRFLQRIMGERDKERIWNPIDKIDLLAEKMIHYCKMHTEQKIQIDTKREGEILEHTIYVTLIVLQISIQMCIPTIILYQIVSACLLHDVGLIIDKKLDKVQNHNQYQKHPTIMYKEVEKINWLSNGAAEMILYHHERRDGSGFPYNKKKFPLEYEILQVADFFDRTICGFETEKLTLQETKDLLQKHIGTWYDKKVVTILFERIAYED